MTRVAYLKLYQGGRGLTPSPMTDIFRSAFNYISQTAPIRPGSGSEHPLVGTLVDVNGIKVKIRALLAEGGYALVFSCQDAQGNSYALKRQLAGDREAADAIIKEIKFLKELSGHQSIVQFVQACQINPKDTNHGRAEFLLLTELLSGGPLINILQQKELNPEQILKIIYATSTAVRHMHDRSPPITHRDLKIENLLIDRHGFIKLVDFGSATTDIYRPDDTWSAIQRSLLEEDMARFTTPMYRAPEILDTYQNFPIGPSQDIWALGCILYYLCYRVHPFEDSAKLRIINAKYTIPENPGVYGVFTDLIKSMLQPDPYMRPIIYDVVDRLEMIAFNAKIDVTKPISGLDLPSERPPIDPRSDSPRQDSARGPPLRPPPPGQTTQAGQAPQVAEMFSQVKSQGLSLFKNIKEKSAAVLQTVQTNYAPRDAPTQEPLRQPRNFDPGPVPASSNASIVNPFENPAQGKKPSPNAQQPAPVPSDDFFSTLSWGDAGNDGAPASSTTAQPQNGTHGMIFEETTTTTTMKAPPRPPVPPHQRQQPPSDDFFSNLGWENNGDGAAQPRNDVVYQETTTRTEVFEPNHTRIQGEELIQHALIDEAEAYERLSGSKPKPTPKHGDAEAWERMAGIRVQQEEEADDADQYKFDYEKKPFKNNSANNVDRLINEVEDLLDLGSMGSAQKPPAQPSFDPFACFGVDSNQSTQNKASTLHHDLDLHLGSLPRNASAPVIDQKAIEKPAQKFERLFANDPVMSKSANSSQSNLFGRCNFEWRPITLGTKTKLTESTFDDLLSNQGFNFTSKNANRTLADLQKEEDLKYMDPISIKIRDWKKGKEKNIRTLLGSLHEVLWEGATGWRQPNMADLFNEAQVKKYYQRACLVVHPDKQHGTPNEELAKAIFKEVNEAWAEFKAQQ